MTEFVYIAAGARTPMGGLQGCFANMTAVDLGSVAIAEAVARANLSGDDVDEVITMRTAGGHVLRSPEPQSPRQGADRRTRAA